MLENIQQHFIVRSVALLLSAEIKQKKKKRGKLNNNSASNLTYFIITITVITQMMCKTNELESR